MSGREEHIDWISGALAGLGVEGHVRDDWAPRLYNTGVRVLGPDEVILDRVDAKLLDLVRQAAERWDELKRQATAARPDSLAHPQVATAAREELLLAALNGAGKPLTRVETVLAATGWHRDYQPSSAEWDPWRAAWRNLLIQRRVRRTNQPDLGAESLWEAVPVPAGGWHPTLVEFWERQREFPGLCVAQTSSGRSTMYGFICGKPEKVVDSGACEEHEHD